MSIYREQSNFQKQQNIYSLNNITRENNDDNDHDDHDDENNVCPIQQRGLLRAAIQYVTTALLDQQRAVEIENLEAGLGLGGIALIYCIVSPLFLVSTNRSHIKVDRDRGLFQSTLCSQAFDLERC